MNTSGTGTVDLHEDPVCLSLSVVSLSPCTSVVVPQWAALYLTCGIYLQFQKRRRRLRLLTSRCLRNRLHPHRPQRNTKTRRKRSRRWWSTATRTLRRTHPGRHGATWRKVGAPLPPVKRERGNVEGLCLCFSGGHLRLHPGQGG